MRKTILIAGALAMAMLVSCEKKKDFEIKVAEPEMSVGKKLDVKVDNEFDPVCGMPTAEYLSDTLHYEHDLLGFCSTACKETFAHNPVEYLDEPEIIEERELIE